MTMIAHRKYSAGVKQMDVELDPTGFFIPRTSDPRHGVTAAALSAVNACYYGRVIGGGSVASIGLIIGVQSGNICVAVYTNSGEGRSGVPLTRVATSGSVACPASGYAAIALDVAVDVSSGQYWFAVAADNTTATFVPSGSVIAVSELARGFGMSQASAFPCPATSAASTIRGNIPVMIGVPA